MEKVEYRSVIKFLFLQGKTASNVHEEMRAVYKDDCPSYDVVKHWCRQFRCGRLSVQDEPRCGRPSVIECEDISKKIELLILEDRRITISNIVATTG